MRNLYSENAFTGLEAAIVLIAFVVVAAVFSYVVLGAGFFTSQTAQSTVHTGVSQASSSLQLVGNVYGIKDSTANQLDYVNATIALTVWRNTYRFVINGSIGTLILTKAMFQI